MKPCEQRRGRYLAPLLALALLLSSRLAFAQAMGPGGYIGLGLGQSNMDDPDNTLLGVTARDHDTAFKIFGGMMFNPYIGIELGYVDFGSFTGEFPREDWKASSVDFSVLAAVPLPDRYSNFSLFGKIGANAWSVDDSLPGFGTISASGTSASYGLGGEFEVNREMGINLQWERFTNVGDPATTGRSDIDLVTANFVYHFRPVERSSGYGYPYGGRRRGRY